MPVIKSAKKKQRQDKKRTLQNAKVRNLLKTLLKKAKKNPSAKIITEAVTVADKAAKNNIIHKNKASHIKSKLYAQLKAGAKEEPVAKKTPVKKTTTKKKSK